MEPGPSEARAQEIEKTTERYVRHRWINWLPFAAMAIGIGWMLLCAWLVQTALRLAGRPWDSPPGYSLYLWIVFPLMFAGILALIVLFASWYDPWRKRALGVKTKGDAQPLNPKHLLLTLLFTVLYPGCMIIGTHHLVDPAPLRFRPLLFLLCCLVLPAVFLAAGWLPRPKGKPIWSWLWEESPPFAIALIVWVSYSLAVAAGLPQPCAASLKSWGSLGSTFLPFGVLWLLALIAGEFYSRAQFRRLQRLLASTPRPAGSDGTD